MKISMQAIKLFLVISLLPMLSCGGGGSATVSAGNTTVQVNLLSSKQSVTANTLQLTTPATAPSGVRFIRITISALDMPTVEREVDVAGRTDLVETFYLPNGKNRRFHARAVDGLGGSLFQGDISADLDGTTKKVDILMGVDLSGMWQIYLTPQGGSEGPPDSMSIIQTGNAISASTRDAQNNVISADGTIIGNGIKLVSRQVACGNSETSEYKGAVLPDGTAGGTRVTTGGCTAGTTTAAWRMKREAIPPLPPPPLPDGFPTDLPAADYLISTQVCAGGTCSGGGSFTVINSDIRQFAQLLINALTTAINESLNSNCGQTSGGCSCISPIITYAPWNGTSFTITDSFDITCGGSTSAVSIQYTVIRQ